MKSKILLLFISLLFISNASASAHIYDNIVSNGERPFQIYLNVSNGTGTNNATHFYCNGNCSLNFLDVRFILNHTTYLPFWIKNSTTGEFIVNMTNNGTMSILYGVDSLPSGNNGAATFPFFEDFSGSLATNWTTNGNVDISNGELRLYGTTTWGNNGAESIKTISRPFILEWEQRISTMSQCSFMSGWFITPNNNPATWNGIGLMSDFNTKLIQIYQNGSTTNWVPYDIYKTYERLYIRTPVGYNITHRNTFNYGSYNITSYYNNSTMGGDNLNINFQAFSPAGAPYIYVDNVRIRNYASTEPVWNSTWTNIGNYIQLSSISPTNNSIVSSPVTFMWKEFPADLPHTLYVATDNQYLNIVSTSTITSCSDISCSYYISGLSAGTYWWKVKNNSGYYTDSMNFTLSTAVPTPGRLNLTVFNEQDYSNRIINFTAEIYDTNGTKITKNSTSGWCNLSSSEINYGIYLAKISNSSYRERSVLFISPANVTMYLPNTNNTIDLSVFVLNDYTGQFPWSSTILKIYNNNSLMYSSYFSADAKIPVYLIDASTYAVHLENGDNTRIWGNYVPYANQEVGILINTIDLDTKDFSYNISNSDSKITLSWSGVSNIRYVNYTIYKGDSRAVEYTLNTSLDTGETNYIKSGSDIYYVVFNSSTIHSGFFAVKKIFEDRTVKERYPGTIFSGNSSAWKYDTFILPNNWAYAAATGLLILLAVSFNVYFGWFGALITVMFANMFYYWKWLPQITYTNADGTPGLDYGQGLLILLFIISVWLMRKDSGD